MAKRKIFLAYCSKRHQLASELKRLLEHDFEVVLWQQAQWIGGILLNRLIQEIESCQFGVAILSCDDKLIEKEGISGSDEFTWAPRDNVILELGFFLSHFGKHRTAIISVTEVDGSNPKMPTDLSGWLLLNIHMTVSVKKLKDIKSKISSHFSEVEAQVVPSLVPASATRRAFNVLTIEDARNHWGKFPGKFYCLNPSWTLELKSEDWMHVHFERYNNPLFTEANYIVDVDRGRDIVAIDGPTNGRIRILDENRDLLGITRFITELIRKYPSVAEDVEKKLKIYVRPGVRSEMTTFFSRSDQDERAFLFVRRLQENTVLEARSPEHVKTLRDHIQVFMTKRSYFYPSQLAKLCEQMIGN